jgi:hypothetical protein
MRNFVGRQAGWKPPGQAGDFEINSVEKFWRGVMAIGNLWEKWVYWVAKPIGVEDREHTAEEVRDVAETVAFVGTSRGLGVGISTGLILGISLPLLLWFASQYFSVPKPQSEENELRQLRGENERLRALSLAPKPAVDENELKQLQVENERLRAENEKLKSQQPVADKPKEKEKPVVAEKAQRKERKAVVARPVKKKEEPQDKPPVMEASGAYTCGDGRTVTNPAECRANAGTSRAYTCGDGRTVTNPAECRANKE